MANGTIDFFAPTDPSLGLSSEWTFVDGGAISTTRTRSQELARNGDELMSRLHDGKSTTSFVYVFKQPATPVTHLTFPKVGSVANGWHVDGFRCEWDRQRVAPRLTVNCHRHTAGTNHSAATNAPRTYTPSLTTVAPVDFGVPSAFGSAFALANNAVVDLRTATYEAGCQHTDELGRTGEELRGNNYDGYEKLSVELTGAATSDDYTSSWDLTDDGVSPSQTGATSSSFAFEHHIACDVPANQISA